MILDVKEHRLEVNVEDAITLIHALSAMVGDHHKGKQLVIVQTLPVTIQDGTYPDDAVTKNEPRYLAGKLTLIMGE